MEATMGGAVVRVVADNIVSPLGYTTSDNLEAVLSGETKLQRHEGAFGLPEAFCGSLLEREEIAPLLEGEVEGEGELTLFERLCIFSAQRAIRSCGLSAKEGDVLFVLSTTKGNVEYLAESLEDSRCYLSGSADRIARYFGNPNIPLVVSNACISGVCAQIVAIRELMRGRYSHAVVIGGDVLSKFIVSGFQSFKALSPIACKPYDAKRDGLNLGEAVGTIILSSELSLSDEDCWQYVCGSIHNDANHISGPSRTGEGSYRVLKDILQEVGIDEIGFVNVHGTSTPYNDEMESIALHRADMDAVPINGLKGYYGHTLGAAGIVETILSMRAMDRGLILPTKGFEVCGTSYAVNISNQTRTTSKKAFVKLLSGFGGSNAGICYRKGGCR